MMDLQSMRALCMKTWPQLTWQVLPGEGGIELLLGKRHGRVHKWVVRAVPSGSRLVVALARPAPLGHLYADMQIEDAPTALPRLLTGGRRWWGHGSKGVRGAARSRGA